MRGGDGPPIWPAADRRDGPDHPKRNRGGDLSLDQDTTLRVDSDNGGYNLVVIENHTVRVAEASCPDQVCVRHGATDQTADPIACLPNGLVVVVVANPQTSQLDGVT